MRLKALALVMALWSAGATNASGQTIPTDSAQTFSPLAFPRLAHAPAGTDEVFVTETPELHTECLFSSDGPLEFDILITRAIGNLSAQQRKAVYPAYAKLDIACFDIDHNVGTGYAPELDRVTINGHDLDLPHLAGVNCSWRVSSFAVPIEFLNFAQRDGHGAPTAGVNSIRIEIDTANPGDISCTAIAWGAITIRPPRPVLLAHGILTTASEAWGGLWSNRLENVYGIPYRNDMNLGPLAAMSLNAATIADNVDEMKTEWGVQKINIVSHSKGGLDSRYYLGHLDPGASVERLIQIGTPNAGSPWADLVTPLVMALVPEYLRYGSIWDLAAGWQLMRPHMLLYNLFNLSTGETDVI